MKYKLLILDVDGTLVESRQHAQPSSKVIEAVSKVNKKIKISLCTGRPYFHIKKIIDTLKITNSLHVVETGTKVVNSKGEIEYEKFLKKEEIRIILNSMKDLTRCFGLCLNGRWEWKATKEKIKQGNITIVALHPANQKQIDEIILRLNPIKDKVSYHIGSSWNPRDIACVHITNKKASKEHGLSYIQKKLDIKKEETIGVGDMPNDFPLFKMSGLKIAMGNGSQDLKNVADVIAPSVKENGVAWVINKFIL